MRVGDSSGSTPATTTSGANLGRSTARRSTERTNRNRAQTWLGRFGTQTGTSSPLRPRRFGVKRRRAPANRSIASADARTALGDRPSRRFGRRTVQTGDPATPPFYNARQATRLSDRACSGLGGCPRREREGHRLVLAPLDQLFDLGRTCWKRDTESAFARAPRYRYPGLRPEDPGKWHPAAASATAGHAPL